MWCRQVDELREHVEAWTGNRCQVYEIDSLRGHVEHAEPVVAEWRRDAIPLFGEDLCRILATSPTDPVSTAVLRGETGA